MSNLFFYGVLRADVAQWPFLAGLGRGQPATTRGTLHAIPDPNGWYPALTPGEGIVHGVSHEAGAVDIAAIDAFEGTDYERVEIVCEWVPSPANAPVVQSRADVYMWVAPMPEDAQPIAHGDFARWLADTGNAPLSGR